MKLPKRPLPEKYFPIPKHAKRVFKGEVFDTYQYEQEQFDGSFKTFEMIKRPDTVLVLAVKDDGRIWLLSEEQPGRQKWSLSLPGGRVDPGEATFAAAQRECEEEIGAHFKDWYYVESVQLESKIDWYIHVFAAKNLLTSVPTRHDAGEKIEILDGTYEEFLAKSSAAIRIPAFQKHKTIDEVINNATKLEDV